MKLKLLILIFFVNSFKPLFSQQTTFQKNYNALNIFMQFEIIQTNDNGFLTGNTGSLLKIDSIGHKEWMKQFVANFFSLDSIYNGGYIATGSSHIIKFNNNFSISWAKSLSGINGIGISSALFTVRTTQDSGIIIGGGLNVNNDAYFMLIKTDSSGIVQWAKAYAIPGEQQFSFLNITPDGFMLCGRLFGNPYSNIALLKVDTAGNSQWAKNYIAANSQTFCNHITNCSDGGFAITGYRNLHEFILKIDSAGNKVWEKFYDSPFYGTARWVEETKDNGLIIAGDIEGNDSGFVSQACLLMKTDSLGNLEWARELGGFAEVWTGCVKQAEDDGYIVAARKPGIGTNDVFAIIKTDSLGHTNGCLEGIPTIIVSNLNDSMVNVPVTDSVINVTAIPIILTDSLMGSEITLCAPIGIEESQIEKTEIAIYPNPFTKRFKVSGLRFQGRGKTSIVIFDLMGEQVFEKEFSSDKTEEELNLSFLQQGVYFLNVKSNGVQYTRKIIKM
jgi:hypothetical protein